MWASAFIIGLVVHLGTSLPTLTWTTGNQNFLVCQGIFFMVPQRLKEKFRVDVIGLVIGIVTLFRVGVPYWPMSHNIKTHIFHNTYSNTVLIS